LTLSAAGNFAFDMLKLSTLNVARQQCLSKNIAELSTHLYATEFNAFNIINLNLLNLFFPLPDIK
jgi:hypothetical protein